MYKLKTHAFANLLAVLVTVYVPNEAGKYKVLNVTFFSGGLVSSTARIRLPLLASTIILVAAGNAREERTAFVNASLNKCVQSARDKSANLTYRYKNKRNQINKQKTK